MNFTRRVEEELLYRRASGQSPVEDPMRRGYDALIVNNSGRDKEEISRPYLDRVISDSVDSFPSEHKMNLIHSRAAVEFGFDALRKCRDRHLSDAR